MAPTDHDHPVDPARVDAARRALAASRDRLDVLALLAEPVRQRIVRALLAVGELCVGDLALALDVSQDSISYATRQLRNAGVVERRTAGRYGYYRLASGPIRDAMATVYFASDDSDDHTAT